MYEANTLAEQSRLDVDVAVVGGIVGSCAVQIRQMIYTQLLVGSPTDQLQASRGDTKAPAKRQTA
jgi:hypothetical protein